MEKKSFIKKIESLPVPILATMVGACTLSNIYASLGYTWVQAITMISSIIVFICFALKIIVHRNTFIKEYTTVVSSSLYAAFFMLLMILSSYLMTWVPQFKYLISIAAILHFIHIAIFLFRNLVKGFDMHTFVPTWFVTVNGVMVSTVVGAKAMPPILANIVLYWGIFIYFIVVCFMVYRLFKVEVKDHVYHTQAVLVAPACLVFSSYLNVVDIPNPTFVYILYACVFISLLFVMSKIPKFFSYKFTPGFAGLTFPLAIACVATNKMSTFLLSQGYETASHILNQIAGLQIYSTTVIIGFVLYNFMRMYVSSYKN